MVALLKLLLRMGIRMQDLPGEDEMSAFAKTQFDLAFKGWAEEHPREVVVERPPSPPKEPEAIQDPMELMRQRLLFKKKRQSRVVTATASASKMDQAAIEEALRVCMAKEQGSQTQAPEVVEEKTWEPPAKYSRMELLNIMAMAVKLGGFSMDLDCDYYSVIRNFLSSLSKDLETEFRENMLRVGNEIGAEFSRINFCGNRILVKEKCNIEIQTDELEKEDMECQTAQPEKASAAGKPKKK